MKTMTCVAAILLAASLAAFANIRNPDIKPVKTPKPKPAAGLVTSMSIRLDREATEARLIIPKAQLKQLRAELEELDEENDNTAAVVTTPGVSRTQTIMSGIFLSLAIVFGGMWFARSGKAATKAGKGFVAVAVVAGVAAGATYIYANAGPPPEARSITGKMFSQAVHIYGFGGGEVRLEAGSEDHIKLIVPNPKTERPSE
jgi:hypothetical protein